MHVSSLVSLDVAELVYSCDVICKSQQPMPAPLQVAKCEPHMLLPTSFKYADITAKALTPAKFAELYAMCVESKSLQFANRHISSDESGRSEEREFRDEIFIICIYID